jgi:hypothetical protein
MRVARIHDLPNFDTGQFVGARFLMASGSGELTVQVEGMRDIVLSFTRLRWHEFTAVYNCSPEQVESAFFKLVELEGSAPLAKYVASDRASSKAYHQLHHYRIFLHEHGCHELFAESASIS